MLGWVMEKDHAIVDVNVNAKQPVSQQYRERQATAHQRLACYVWDNLAQCVR